MKNEFITSKHNNINGGKPLFGPRVIYVASMDKIYFLGGIITKTMDWICSRMVRQKDEIGFSQSIWYKDLNKNNSDDIWIKHPIELPHKSSRFCCLLLFQHILFIFYGKAHQYEIYALDLKHNEIFKSKKQFINVPDINLSSQVLIDHTAYFAPKFNQSLFIVDLMQCIPHEIIKLYTNDAAMLIDGFLRTFIENIYGFIVPTDVKCLIIKYYPIFL